MHLFENTISFDAVLLISVIMILVGFFSIRLAGRKSLSKMTISQAVIMIAVGSLLVEPIKEAIDGNVKITTVAIFMFILVLFVLEFVALKSSWFERVVIGMPRVLIVNGQIQYGEMKRLRLSETQLQALLRQKNVSKVEDIKTLTIEPNGNIGIEKKESVKPMTIKDFKRLTGNFFKPYEVQEQPNDKKEMNLFDEVKNDDEPV